MSEATAVDVARNDIKILSLVSAGHFCSHFYMLTLPALFIFLNRDLGTSFTLLGAMLSARYVATGMAQIPAGFMVDRFGAKPVLMVGIFVMVTAFALMAFAPNYWVLFLLVVIGGLGNLGAALRPL